KWGIHTSETRLPIDIAFVLNFTCYCVRHLDQGCVCFQIFSATSDSRRVDNPFLNNRHFDCGPYGFTCEGQAKLRLCEGLNLFGPSFLCPPDTICNEDSSDVCENTNNYIEPSFGKTIRCHRHERIADPNVPGCKGYILCIPNKNRFQGIKFKCSGTTIFNGYTRACSAPDKYKCPIANTTQAKDFYIESNRRIDTRHDVEFENKPALRPRPLCKNYKFTVTQDQSPAKAAYFCPSRPVPGERAVRCTVFSNQFCITLERYNEDQFVESSRAAYRRPRFNNFVTELDNDIKKPF
ncbi:uncharacterized protein LOC134662686, partial [Cydia amplana]|uniref:uncharacterized protein LOC134662686 n=1 Tax=Cydia amplana TaxID=1869771 RepID=UPI002FE533FC